MASETTVASHQTTIFDEQVEPVKEDEKTVVQESPLTKKGGEDNSKSEDSSILPTDSPETKAAEDNQIEPLVDEVLKANVASELDITKIEPDSSLLSKESAKTFPCLTIPPAEFEGQEDKLIEPSTVEVEMAVDAPNLDVLLAEENAAPKEIAEEEKPIKENLKSVPETLLEFGDLESKLIEPQVVEVEKIVEDATLNALVMDETKVGEEQPISESETPLAPESTDTVKSLAEDEIISESIEKEEPKQPATEVEGKGKQLKVVDDLKPSIVATEKPTQESEVTITKEHGYLEARSMEVVKQEPEGEEVEETQGKPLEHEQEVEEKGDKLESEEKQRNEVVKDEEPLADKVEHPALPEVIASNIPISVNQKAESDTKDEGTSLRSLVEKPTAEEEQKKIGKADVITKEAEVKIGEVIEESNEYENSNNRSVLTNEVNKNSIADIDRDAELVQENRTAEHIKDETSAQSESQKENDEETVVKETPGEYKQPEFESSQEAAKKSEQEQVESSEKSDSNIEPPAKGGDGKKSDETPDTAENIRAEHKQEKQGEVTTIAHEPTKQTEPPLSEEKEEEVESSDKSDSNIEPPAKGGDGIKSDETPDAAENIRAEHKKEKQGEVTTIVHGPIKQTEPPLSEEKEEEVVSSEKSDSNIEPPVKGGDGIKSDETPDADENIRAEHKQEKQGEVTTIVHGPIKQTEPPLSEEKEEETAKNEAQKLEKDQVDKFDEGLVSSKDRLKEIPAKGTQKQSNSIISKVKHSLVKAKKAIIGKSHSSKTIVSEAKSDIEVK